MWASAIVGSRAWLLVGVLACSALADDTFPEPYDSEIAERGRPPAASAAASGLALPHGFSATVMAAEPDVQNPIALTWDARGRLWVAENFTYAEGSQRFDHALRDRVLIMEDTDGNGTLDRRSVFMDTLPVLTGIEVGHGGLWAMCPPRLLFIPDRDRDGRPDGPAETILDGFEVSEANYHNFANGLRFGPDGWLYGRCGHSCPARIGSPNALDAARLPMEGGIWRYSPRAGRAEVLSTGTTNPWGLDWNAVAEGFFVNTVNGHLWHLIHGAHFAQANGIDPNPFTYELIDHHADHYHFDVKGGWQNSRDGKADDLGGGHAHSGCMIYAGTNWPADYRGRLFTLNFHGRRANQEILQRRGSGYVARHAPDFFVSGDHWFRGIELMSGPDGSVTVVDWSDTGECHERDGVHRTSGRLFRVAYGQPRLPEITTQAAGAWQAPGGFDLHNLSDVDLARLQRHPDGWWVGQARMVLTERAPLAGDSAVAARAVLEEQFTTAEQLAAIDPRVSAAAHRIRAMLAMHMIDPSDSDRLHDLLHHSDEHVRTWAVRLLTEELPLDAALGPVLPAAAAAADVRRRAEVLLDRLVLLARHEPSGLVRLALASTLQRLPVDLRPALAIPLVSHAEDATDHNLPLLVWYGLIPVADLHPVALAEVATSCRWPTTRRLIARRLAGLYDAAPEGVVQLLHGAAAGVGHDPAVLADVLAGLAEGFAGWRKAAQPTSWTLVDDALDTLPEGEIRDRGRRHADELAILFGDGRAIDAVRDVALNPHATVEMRRRALATLIDAQAPELRSICEHLLTDRHLQSVAARGLSRFNDPAIGRQLVDAGRRARGAARDAIFLTLVSRRSFAGELVAAVEQKRIPVSDLSAAVIRQIHALGDDELSDRVSHVWGHLRESPAAKKERIRQLSERLATPDEKPDLGAGRLLFEKTCGSCHRLYGTGGQLGPDLTGSGRHDQGYLLENMVDPSAVVNRDWRLSILSLTDGRVLSGVVVEHTERAVVLLTLQERVTIPTEEIDAISQTDRSPMPDGLLDQLDDSQIRDLVGYLQHPTQVPVGN
jgi:putative membrane-bound dehydrogenase-like protein